MTVCIQYTRKNYVRAPVVVVVVVVLCNVVGDRVCVGGAGGRVHTRTRARAKYEKKTNEPVKM